LHPIPSIETP
jgi:hypothetical protein